MKTKITIMMILCACAHGKDIYSPSRQWSIKGGGDAPLELVDNVGMPVIDLIPDAKRAETVRVAWAGDSDHVLICAQYKRGSVIYGLWYDGVNWHKTIQGDEDQYGIVRLAQQKLGGKLQKETRWFAGGMNGDSVTVRGRMTMTNGKSVQYQYELEFMPKFFVSTRLSPAGFELGMIAGKDYKLL